MNGTFRPPLPPHFNDAIMAGFGRRAPSSLLGGKGVNCSFLFCPRLKVGVACEGIKKLSYYYGDLSRLEKTFLTALLLSFNILIGHAGVDEMRFKPRPDWTFEVPIKISEEHSLPLHNRIPPGPRGMSSSTWKS